MNASSGKIMAAINRFGLGAKPGEPDTVRDPDHWLETQIARGLDGNRLLTGLPSSLDYLRQQAQLGETRREIRQGGRGRRVARRDDAPPSPADTRSRAQALRQALRPYRKRAREEMLAELGARFRVATSTSTPFLERMVHFWSNHFAVSVDKGPARMFAAPMEREAIRPHVTGRFADMLLAVETHPAMLLYLDNVRSVGPDSRMGRRTAARLARQGDMAEGKAGGLNENLGRESMELHTVGVNGGYTQADVTEFSRALTGWSVALPRDFARGRQPSSAFVFRAAAHEPGARHVMGHTFREGGFKQGKAILEFLAHQPATARRLALQLAQELVADTPPPALVERLARSYLDHDTNLAAVYRTLIQSPEAWGADARKFRTPQDWVIAALRAGQIDLAARPQPMLAVLKNLGEPVFDARSPSGFTDNSANWIDADALWKRVQAAEALAARVPRGDDSPAALARDILGPLLDEDTALAIERAESRRQAHATLFACPTFQWRV